MKDALIIINPVAGRGGYKNGLGDALHTLYKNGIRPTLSFTKGTKDATHIAAAEAKNYELICCVGGDGTLSEVVAGLMEVDAPPPIGYIPLGTANDVATTLRLPKNDMSGAARIIARGVPRYWDVGRLGTNGYFTYVAAFGAFTDVSYETSQQRKQMLGQFAYLLEGLTRLPHLPHYNTRVEMNDRVLEGDYIFGGVLNSTSVAGLVKLDPAVVQLDDGKFEVALVKNPGSLAALNKLVNEVLTQNYEGQYFEVFQTDAVKFSFGQDVPLTRDGESGGIYSEVSMTNCPRAVQILVP